MANNPIFVTLGMFIIDQFEFLDEEGNPTERPSKNEIGGGGTYAVVGARAWLPPDKVGMIVDRGPDFPPSIQKILEAYGDIWLFRDRTDTETTKALNSYRGEHRSFKYLTPRLRITPQDLCQTKLDRPKILHFICSPSRASAIMTEVREVQDWEPIAIYEPIPDRCIPAELPALVSILPQISILRGVPLAQCLFCTGFDTCSSPNAEEALSLLSIALPPTPSAIENAAHRFLELGVKDAVVIRSGGLGAYVVTEERGGKWIPAFWSDEDTKEVVDVTGAGNSFLGGLGAGFHVTGGDIYEASLYGAVSASFTIQQGGLPTFSVTEGSWNQDFPMRRLEALRKRCNRGPR